MSATLDRCTALLGEPNIRAFLRVIREGETNQSDDAYRMAYGGKLIDGPEHPWYGRTTTEVGHSTAYGAYQFLGTSWKEASDALGLGNNTSPVNQDLCAVQTIDVKRHATSEILAGDLVLACSKLATEWVSLPGLGLARVQQVFTDYGGKLAAQNDAGAPISPAPIPTYPDAAPSAPAAGNTPPQPEPVMPVIMQSLLPMVLQLFAPRAQAVLGKVTGQPADVLQPFLADLFAKIAGATGVVPVGEPVTTDAQAVAAVAELQKLKTTNAALVTQIENHALDYLDKIAPLFDKLAEADAATNAALLEGRNAASERAVRERWDMTPWLVWIAGGTATILVLALLGAIIWQATTGERAIDVALIGLAGPLLAIAMGVWREIFAYRFDGSPASNSSAALNEQIATAAKRGSK